MLKSVKIENLALISSAEMIFEKGMTALTGETGAGKSVIVSALELALGERADKDIVRYGMDSGSVTVTFDVSRQSADYQKQFSEFIESGAITIERVIKIKGNSTISVSGIPTTLVELKDITKPLAEILGQHANQLLMYEENHIDFLDNFAELTSLKEIVAESFEQWKQSAEKLAKLISKRDSMQAERELLLFQQKEISQANIFVGESDELIAEKKILDSARALMTSAQTICDIIDNDENSTSSLLTLAQKEIDEMAEIDESLQKQSEELIDITYRLTDFKNMIEQYGSSIEDNPNRIEEINLRLDEIYKLKKKYGGSEQGILDSLTIIEEKLKDVPADIDDYIRKLEKETAVLFGNYSKEAISLSQTRKKAAAYLQKIIKKELEELAIDNAQFEIEFLYEEDVNGVLLEGKAVKPTSNGLESARILFSANPGEPLKSLVKTASGGEISRVLLALKAAEKKNNRLSKALMVFDEVDAGIGGKTALEVAAKLKKLSEANQLLVITHLHQIAREADSHFTVQKTTGKEKRTIINVVQLDKPGIDAELKRMIALPE